MSTSQNQIAFRGDTSLRVTDKEKPIATFKTTQRSLSTNALTNQTIHCGEMAMGEYWNEGDYSYPSTSLNFGNTIGTDVTIELRAYGTPNQFVLLGPNYNIVAQSGWLGTANYDGPWGDALSNDNGVFTFTVDKPGDYTLQVETQVSDVSDFWEAYVSCVEPTKQEKLNQIGQWHNDYQEYLYSYIVNQDLDITDTAYFKQLMQTKADEFFATKGLDYYSVYPIPLNSSDTTITYNSNNYSSAGLSIMNSLNSLINNYNPANHSSFMSFIS